MLLQEQMKQDIFSYNEKTIIDFILEKQEQIKDYSTKMIGDETYTAPSTIIRIAHKLGFQGWSDFKESFLDEVIYLNNHFQEIDPNFPFTNQDTMMQIAHKITQLHIESAKDTASLIQHDTLQKALRIMAKADVIKVFAVANLNFIGEEFVFKLNRIHKRAYIEPVQDNQFQDAIMTTSNECAICVPSIPLAPPLRLEGAEEMIVLLLGVWNKPNPAPQINRRHIISVFVGLSGNMASRKRPVANIVIPIPPSIPA